MGPLVNDFFQDIKWGRPPVPLLPKSLIELWSKEPLPHWMAQEMGLAEDATISSLGKGFWLAPHQVSFRRVQHYLMFLLQSRRESILQVKCFDTKWPTGLNLGQIPFSVRSKNRLIWHSFISNPEALMDATYGLLLSIPGLGLKSALEICTLIETASDLYRNGIERIGQLSPDIELSNATEVFGEGGELIKILLEVLKEPWADEIDEQDPRFKSIPMPGHGTIADRIERILSDPYASVSDAHAMAKSIPEVRAEAERINSQFLEDNLIDLLTASIGSKHLNAMALRLGWLGEEPKTLQQCADIIGVSRERVRQIEVKTLNRLPKTSVYLPAIDLGISVLESAAPISIDAAAQLLVDHGLCKKPFSPLSLLNLAALVHRETSLAISDLGDQRLVASESSEHLLGKVIRTARRIASSAGIASVFQVADVINETSGDIRGARKGRAARITEEAVTQILERYNRCEFLGEDWFWITDLAEGRNRLANVTKKILSIATPQSISSIREGVQRAFRYRYISKPESHLLVVPPHAVIAKFFERHPDFKMAGELVGPARRIDYRDVLGEGEQALYDVMRRSPAGVLDRRSLMQECIDRGLNENTLSVYSTYSPILEHVGLDLWKLRGIRVDPAAIEAVRQQNNLRPSVNRLIEYGWSPAGLLWIAWRLPSSANGVVLNVPGAVRRYLGSGRFKAICKGTGKLNGEIAINDSGSSYGYGRCLRYLGADENDTLLAEFDLSSSKAEISIVDDAILNHE